MSSWRDRRPKAKPRDICPECGEVVPLPPLRGHTVMHVHCYIRRVESE
jgi:hypothetical protein